jgi:adenylate kinase family enzyme
MRRINVIGTSCSGKSTFAKRLGKMLNLPYVELDHFNFEADWVEVKPEVFREKVLEAVKAEGWIVDGNYSIARDMIWPIADTIIWLDYPLRTVLWRSIKRTIRRSVKGEPCCNGNRESFRRALSRESIILWVLTTHASRRKRFMEVLPKLASPGREIVVLRSPEAAQCWLMKVRPEPMFKIGQHVRVVLNERNSTSHSGEIFQIEWHFKDQRFNYYLVENEKPVTKRYLECDLELILEPPALSSTDA